MNIFILHNNIEENVKMYCDQHVRKMIIETAQLLSFVHHKFPSDDIDINQIYKNSKSHSNHPCTIWTQSSINNYKYLSLLGKYLGIEYTYRFGKIHATEKVIEYLSNNIPNLPNIPMTTFALTMPEIYQDKSDVVGSYRTFYINEKQVFKRGPATWTKRKKPKFLIN